MIFNADDLGLSCGVNKGILKCYLEGIVSSSSLLVNMPGFEDAIRIIKTYKLKNVGLHVNLTEGQSVLPYHKHLTDNNQNFYSNFSTIKHVCEIEIYNEILAQYQKALKAGISINHVDSHYNIHTNYRFQKAFIRFSNTFTLPLRKINYRVNLSNKKPFHPLFFRNFVKASLHNNYYSENLVQDFFGNKVSKEILINLIHKNRDKKVEIVCHPGYIDKENGAYNQKREVELELLCDPEIIELVKGVNS